MAHAVGRAVPVADGEGAAACRLLCPRPERHLMNETVVQRSLNRNDPSEWTVAWS